jgi:asparagine synthase (glutamine-hydrolysing)
MCGIAGFVTATGAPARSGDTLKSMTAVIAHRGPDATGFHTGTHAFLGHRRLSIIDLATGHQPMYNEDGSLCIVYNGEIFNHNDLRPSLEANGHVYRSHCDTETILHSYEQHGPDCLKYFRGMFAFVIWDDKSQTLFCARDRLGIKPFYYFENGRTFAFASEIKALLEHPDMRAEFDESTISEYLAFGYVSSERTLFRNIRQLMPGHHMTVRIRDGRFDISTQQYWDAPHSTEPADTRSPEEWIRECRERLEETVRMRLMSDVPLGVFLSGGLDSSAIAALAQRMVPDPLNTFSVGYAEAEYSELGFAQSVASHIGTRHHEVRVGMDEFFNALPRLVWHEDEPITWPSSVSLYFVSQLAAQHVKVVLTGEGSDEIFAGYARYRHYLTNHRFLSAYRFVPEFARRAIRQQISDSRLLSADLRRKLQHTFLGLGDSVSSLLLDNFYSAFTADDQRTLLKGAHGDSHANYMRYWDAGAQAAVLQRLLYADQKTYLVELLMKQDRMSMACSIESRVPLLDHTFVEFAARVPAPLKLRDAGKYILKKAVEDVLPHDIIYRTKMGFPTPLRAWFRSSRATVLHDVMRDREGLLAAYIEPTALEQLLTEHQNGHKDHTDRLWRLLNLQVWGDLYITGRRGSGDTLMMPTPAATIR